MPFRVVNETDGVRIIQHLIWHEGYHHGQIKLALQAAGLPLADEVAGPLTWGVWMRRRDGGSGGN
ncbi:hypothetical protein [Deinococcus aquaticus]|uniref:hypothetical protein n=1 Tax=Deinococcus aquaticus TaxID=328692 RepID=UPI003F449275